MAISGKKLKIGRGHIETGTLDTFSDLFIYVPKNYVAMKLGIKYSRFLLLTRDPRPLRYEHTIKIAQIFKVAPRKISILIHNQIEGVADGK